MDKISIHYFTGSYGVQLAYREIGQGRPLLLFHGFMGTAQQAWVNNGYAAKMAALGHRVILPDLRGHGDSAKPHEAAAYPADVLADDGFALLEQLGIAEYDLGGYSLGARVALRMLVRRAAAGKAILAGQGLDTLSRATERTVRNQHILSHFGMFESGSPEWTWENWVRKSGSDPLALLYVLGTFVDTPVEALAQIKAAVLVITGTEDYEHAFADKLAALLANGRYEAVSGNHMSAFTNPKFMAMIIDFLESAPNQMTGSNSTPGI
ncbi:MAG: alpha/beta hydrolase [Anaerolineaceae bacterium]|nr:alpha/beta hydrolase [Anaerolineaceae bacterium]